LLALVAVGVTKALHFVRRRLGDEPPAKPDSTGMRLAKKIFKWSNISYYTKSNLREMLWFANVQANPDVKKDGGDISFGRPGAELVAAASVVTVCSVMCPCWLVEWYRRYDEDDRKSYLKMLTSPSTSLVLQNDSKSTGGGRDGQVVAAVGRTGNERRKGNASNHDLTQTVLSTHARPFATHQCSRLCWVC
jgi:hypothetical protein